jgi:DNA-binding YbaB/EbfC family protein
MKMRRKKIKGLMRQAQLMQEQLQQQMLESRVEATSGGGAVQVVMDGSKKMHSIVIDPDAVDPEDVEMLQDLVLAAVNEAGRKVDEMMSSRVSSLTGGIL